jgi:DNA-directed RNA polymerase specialized sigma24 family protein
VVFVLKEIEGLRTEQIARILEVRPSTVRNHLLQARRTLARLLRQRYPELVPESSGGEGRR